MTPRRLTFAVGTTLLTASLSTTVVGCTTKRVNEGPEGPEQPHVNEGPATEEATPANEGSEEEQPPEPEPDDIVNTVPSE